MPGSDKPDGMSQPKKTADPEGPDPWEPDEELRQDLGMTPLPADQDLISSDEFEHLHTSPSGGAAVKEDEEEVELLLEEVISLPDDQPREEAQAASQPARTADPGALTVLEAEIAAADTREDIAGAAVRLAASYARAVGIFVVNKDTIAGLGAEGGGLAERIEGVLISTETETLFSAPLSAGQAFRGAPSSSAGDQRMMKALGRADARDILIVPVLVRGCCSSAGRAPEWHSGGRRFDPVQLVACSVGQETATGGEILDDPCRTDRPVPDPEHGGHVHRVADVRAAFAWIGHGDTLARSGELRARAGGSSRREPSRAADARSREREP